MGSFKVEEEQRPNLGDNVQNVSFLHLLFVKSEIFEFSAVLVDHHDRHFLHRYYHVLMTIHGCNHGCNLSHDYDNEAK